MFPDLHPPPERKPTAVEKLIASQIGLFCPQLATFSGQFDFSRDDDADAGADADEIIEGLDMAALTTGLDGHILPVH
jgi:hypothetical protein